MNREKVGCCISLEQITEDFKTNIKTLTRYTILKFVYISNFNDSFGIRLSLIGITNGLIHPNWLIKLSYLFDDMSQHLFHNFLQYLYFCFFIRSFKGRLIYRVHIHIRQFKFIFLGYAFLSPGSISYGFQRFVVETLFPLHFSQKE